MKNKPARPAFVLAFAFLLQPVSCLLAQGPLTPPGAPAPTMKTLDQVAPRIPVNSTTTPGDATSVFKITQPGSYYLTGNITGVSGKNGIYVTAGNVTLDLMGFDLVGVAGSLDGIHVDNLAASVNYAVRNGSVRNWGGDGIELNVQGKHRVSDIRVLNNGGNGILCNSGVVDGCVAFGNGAFGVLATSAIVSHTTANSNGGTGIKAAIITDCTASSNTGDGLDASTGAVTHCEASVNGGAGIIGDFGTVVTGCSVIANTGNGITLDNGSIATDCYVRGNHAIGISATIGSRIAGCTSQKNDGAGISTGDSCIIEHCVAYFNGLAAAPAAGISAGTSCTITDCASRENKSYGIFTGVGAQVAHCVAEVNGGSAGISVGGESVVSDCVARANTSISSISAGISLGTSGTATNCVASDNTTSATPTASTGMGINASSGCAIHHCIARNNYGDGIRTSSDSVVEGNAADSNGIGTGGGAGIHVTSSDNRVEGNNVTDNDRGIDVDVSGNLVIRNSASGNTSNYEIVAGNAVGAIVVTAASVAISGNGPFASSLTSTDPWANFSY
jgi:parallel beta-helix repeat protein